MKTLVSRLIISSILIASLLEVNGQGFYKLVPTSDYGISIQNFVEPIGYHFGDTSIQVAFQLGGGSPWIYTRFFGIYSSQGDLQRWHQIPNSSNGEYQQVFVYDSIYIQYRSLHYDSSIVSAIDHYGNIIWSDSINVILDPYAVAVADPSRLFVLDHEDYYSYVDFKNGTKQKIWNADSTHQLIQSNLGFDSILTLKRIGQVDTAVYFVAEVDSVGTSKKWLINFKPSCNCWSLSQNVDDFKLIAYQNSAPLLFHQSTVSLSGDSTQYSLSLFSATLDTLWSQSRVEESYVRPDTTSRNQKYTLTVNKDKFYLFERAHSRKSSDSFIPNQYQIGIKYWAMDSTFKPVLETTVWPKDTIGKVINKFFSLNSSIEGSSLFGLNQDSALSVCINRDQQGLGEPVPMLFQTASGGITFLNKLSLLHSTDGKIEVYPNPATNYVDLQTTTKKNLEYSIFNSIGVKLLGGCFEQQRRIDLSGLNEGVYYIVLFNGADLIGSHNLLVLR